MCRWLAYQGSPIFLEDLITRPRHSLIDQSLHAREAKVGTNGDGFGLGWYGHHPEPGVYREVLPAWSDDNLKSLCRQICSPLFLAHVRASTGTATSRANCHPFSHRRWLFVHNGQIGGYAAYRRDIERLIPDAHYGARVGTTDSEALFLIMFANGLERDPVGAAARTLGDILMLADGRGPIGPVRFTAVLSDGQTLWAFRHACDGNAPSLYHAFGRDRLTVVSEPLDTDGDDWVPVPEGHVLASGRDGPPVLALFLPTGAVAA